MKTRAKKAILTVSLNKLIDSFKKEVKTVDKILAEENKLSIHEIKEIGEKLFYLASRDTLMKELHNRAFFEEIVLMKIDKARRSRSKLSLIFFDLDDFKKINTQHGHWVGSKVLIEFGKSIIEAVRRSDVACRYGGDEIAILAEGNTKIAKKVAGRIKNKIKNNRTLKKYKLTFSGGITQFKKEDTLKTFFNRADKALYLSKKKGKNQIAVW